MDSSEQLLWSVQVDHQLFALQKLDVTVSLGSHLQNLIPHMSNVSHRFLFCSIFIDHNIPDYISNRSAGVEPSNGNIIVDFCMNEWKFIFWKWCVIDIHVSRFPVFVWRETAERRWSRVPGTARPTLLTTIVQWCGSSSTRTWTPSARVRIPHSQHAKPVLIIINLIIWWIIR